MRVEPGREGNSRVRGNRIGLAVLVALMLVPASDALAQSYRGGSGWGRRAPPRFADPEAIPDGQFTFARVLYRRVRDEWLGHGWNTDYPAADVNFMWRFAELTATGVSTDKHGLPNHVVVRLTDDVLFQYPFIFMSDVGTVGFDDAEVERLRAYLLKGGFLWVDDFWGDLAWQHWANEIGKVLPPDRYPIVDVAPDHLLYRVLYDVREVPQIPSINYWRRWGGRSGTSERGHETAEPHLRGIQDADGRLLVVMSHNTDIADGWEREGEDWEYFYRFSSDAYAMGFNIVLYMLTH